MTEVLGETDLDWLTLIDYEADIVCSKKNCEAPATWRLVMKCCGLTKFYCTPHKEKQVASGSSVGTWECMGCHNISTSRPIDSATLNPL